MVRLRADGIVDEFCSDYSPALVHGIDGDRFLLQGRDDGIPDLIETGEVKRRIVMKRRRLLGRGRAACQKQCRQYNRQEMPLVH